MTTSPRQRNKQATREDILAAATALFTEREDGQVSMDAICDQAKVSRASAYLHFPSKDAIGLAVSDIETQPDVATIETELAAGRPPVDVLQELFLAQARRVESTPRLAQTVYTYGLREVCSPTRDEELPSSFLATLERIFHYSQAAACRSMADHPLDSQELAIMAYCLFATTVVRWTASPTTGAPPVRTRPGTLAGVHGWVVSFNALESTRIRRDESSPLVSPHFRGEQSMLRVPLAVRPTPLG